MSIAAGQPLVSIIVPVYNSVKYLKECLDSILNQTLSDFELILVDDGSSDGSKKICDEYAKNDSRIKVIHQPNAGVSGARAKGFEHAMCEYIGFVDSDDYVDPDMFRELLRLLREQDADIACCRYQKFNEKGSFNDDKDKQSVNEITVLSPFEALTRMTADAFGDDAPIDVVLWNKLYRREILNKNDYQKNREQFPELYFEDMLLTPIHLSNANKIICTSQRLYYYRVLDDSLSRSSFSSYKAEIYKVKKYILSFYWQHGYQEAYRSYLKGYGNILIKTWLATRKNLGAPEMREIHMDVLKEYYAVFSKLITDAQCKWIYKISFLVFRLIPPLWVALAKLFPLTHIDGKQFRG